MTRPIHSRAPRRWATAASMGTLSSVSLILVHTMLITVLSGGLTAAPDAVPTLPEAVSARVTATPAGLAAPPEPDDAVPPGPDDAVPPERDDAGGRLRSRAGTFGWPLPGHPAVVRNFQAPTLPFGSGHRGVDLAAEPGTAVLAAGAGIVVFAGTVAGRGVVSVDHPGGLRTTYEPVSPTVTAADRVARGQQIGTVALGHPGCAAPACLHWGVRRGPEHDREYLDPRHLLMMARVRLLPIDNPPESPVLPGRSSTGAGVQHLAP